jgi:hypothetical protein
VALHPDRRPPTAPGHRCTRGRGASRNSCA